MNIPLNADVYCTDGVVGRSTCIILNPVTERITHVVVRSQKVLGVEHLVPVSYIAESTPQQIHLNCSRHELALTDQFTRSEYVGFDGSVADIPDLYGPDDVMMWPYRTATEPSGVYVDVEQIPPGELAVHRGAHVEATDGRIGRVDEFLVDPQSGHISHLILREGHLWGQKDVTIPVSEIGSIEDDVVYLKLTKERIHRLPAIPF